MRKTFTRTIEKERRYHQFYCDECNSFITESEEYDDGWAAEPSQTEYRIDGYEFKMLLCDNCKTKLKNELHLLLEKMGFVKKYESFK